MKITGFFPANTSSKIEQTIKIFCRFPFCRNNPNVQGIPYSFSCQLRMKTVNSKSRILLIELMDKKN